MAKSNNRGFFQDLPPELVSDIFSRLKVQDLWRSKFVCKAWNIYWCHLIHDPVFVQLHLSQRNQQDADFLFLCNSFDTGSNLYLVDHDGNNLNTSLKARACLHNMPNHQLQIVGSSNGLLCLAFPTVFRKYLSLYEGIYVCNPVTGDTLELPKESNLDAITETEATGSYKATSCGFAFDSTANAYKVVRTRGYISNSAPRDRTAVEIYTLGSGRSWRRIDDIPTGIFKPGIPFPVFLNGALHWFTYHKGQFPNSIAAIVIGDESFQAFKMAPMPYGMKTNMCLLDVNLCMIYEVTPDMVIWVMKEYGVETSWRQSYKIRIETLPWGVRYLHGWVLPLSVRVARKMSNGSVLIYAQGNQYYCDFENQEYKTLEIDDIDRLGDGDGYFLDLVVHVGSLISPTSIDRCQRPCKAP